MRNQLAAAVVGTVLLTTATTAPGATIRDDGLLEVEGEALFPLGLMDLGLHHYSDWNERIRESGVNFVWDVQSVYGNLSPRCRVLADSARAAGYRILVGSYDTIAWDNPDTPFPEVAAPMYESWKLGELRRCTTTYPEMILGFVNRDEPAWTIANGWVGDIDAEHVHDTYAQLKAGFPEEPIATNFAPAHASGELDEWRAALAPFLDATDIIMHASYPYPPGPGTCSAVNVLGWPDCTMDRLPDNADRFRSEINRPGQPLWMIVQAFKNIPRREARWQAYASIVHGATGLLWAGWTWHHPLGNGADNWNVIADVTREVAGLHDFLVGSDVAGVVSDHGDVDVRAKRHGDEILVLAVSRRGFAGDVRLRLPRIVRGPVDVVGEGRTVTVRRGWIEDRFEEYEAHVYRYRGRNSNAESPAGPLALSARADPHSPRFVLRLLLPRRDTVTVTVHDVTGRRVALAGAGTFDAGENEIAWNGRSLDGTRVASGIYFLRATTAGGERATAKLVVRR